MKKIIVMIVVALIFVSCSKKAKLPVAKLFMKDMITATMVDSLKDIGFNVDGTLLALYQYGKISNEVAFVTESVVGAQKDGTVIGTDLINIYDLYLSHSTDTTTNSSITIYLKDNSAFKIEFIANIDLDEKFFRVLRESWRAKIAEAQEENKKL